MEDCKHTNRKMSFESHNGEIIKTYICKLCNEKLPLEFGDKNLSGADFLKIAFGSGTSITRNKGAEANAVDAREKRWAKDMPAYKRLRQQGIQPKTIDGAARLEAEAETRFEIESGQLLPGQAKNIEDAVNTIESATGKSVYQPNTAPVNL